MINKSNFYRLLDMATLNSDLIEISKRDRKKHLEHCLAVIGEAADQHLAKMVPQLAEKMIGEDREAQQTIAQEAAEVAFCIAEEMTMYSSHYIEDMLKELAKSVDNKGKIIRVQ